MPASGMMGVSSETAEEIRRHLKGDRLTLKVIPKAARTELAGTDPSGVLRIRLKAVPEKGEANKELLRFLSKALRQQVRLVRGATSRTKTVEIDE